MATYGSYLYRRNGRFYARLRIPKPFQAAYGKTHLRLSLDTSEIYQARVRVHEVVLRWQREFLRLRAMLDVQRLVAGSPLILGDGLITIDSASRETGIPVQDLLLEALRTGSEPCLTARAWVGTEVPVDELEFDEDGSFITNSADGLIKTVVTGELFVRKEDLSLAAATGRFVGCLLFRDAARRRPVVFPLHAIDLPCGELLLPREDVETIRVSMATRVTPEMLAHAEAQPTRGAPLAAGTSSASIGSAELMRRFLAAKEPSWSEATKIQMRGMCGVFVELMKDPGLHAIDRALISQFKTALSTLPADLHLARRRTKASTLADLIARTHGEPRMTERRAAAYVAKVGEMFKWAVREGLMGENPAAGATVRQRRVRREQDERAAFTDGNLSLIFSASWFKTGRGERTADGRHWGFQPHMYWLPLLALYAGGRLNELAQLHVSDVRQTGGGTWYLDFNLEAADKIEEPDKRLKTVNSTRCVPLHRELLGLGFIDYVQALKAHGFARVFPELRFDRVKGYGKAAGQWFNERFLGQKLGIERNGMQTFHSFRHNFTTALTQLDPPLGEFTINQLTGHERGESMSARRYAKDASPDVLIEHVNRLSFPLPGFQPFDLADGIAAIEAALARKVETRRRRSP